MALAADDSPITDRRQYQQPIRCRRRWREDPQLAPVIEHLLLLLSRDVHAMRECGDWSQEELADAAGISAQALLNVEKMRDDVHLSTIARIAYAAGYVVDIRFRRPRPALNRSLANPALPAGS